MTKKRVTFSNFRNRSSHRNDCFQFLEMLTFLSWISDCGIFLFFLLFVFLSWLELEWDCYIHMYFQAHCKIYPYKLMYYFSDHLPRLSFIIFLYARLIVCDLPIGLQRLSSFLWPTYILGHVSGVCGLLVSYTWDKN